MSGLILLGLLGLALGLLALPFLPALREWQHPTDTTPLQVVREHDSDIRSFAQRLRAWVALELGDVLAAARQPGANVQMVRWNRDEFAVLPPGQTLASPAGVLPHGVVALGAWQLPAGHEAPREVWCGGDVRIGPSARLRALVSEGAVHLEAGATLDRWLDAEGPVRADDGVGLGRRASSQQALLLGLGVRFERLQAPIIEVTAKQAGNSPTAAPTPSATLGQPEPGTALGEPGAKALPAWWPQVQWLDEGQQHARIKGPVTVPAGGQVPCHLIVEGDLHLEDDVICHGAVKASGQLRMGARSQVLGATFGMSGIDMGEGSRSAGPLVSEGHVEARGGARVGLHGRPTTVSAETFSAHPGSTFHGSIWIRQGGSSIPASPDHEE